MELVELLRLVVDKIGPLVESDKTVWRSQDPGRDLERLVVQCCKVLDKGLLIGRGF